MADGSVRCWGLNEGGQLGDGTTMNRSRPVRVRGVRDATRFSLGFQHSCADPNRSARRCSRRAAAR
ncbi:MAG: RCC1 domain-containing protein [Pseudomonadota bacterium]|nr:hypothetical protein [Gammaproteobacteria bacterium]MDQ3583159.1 RCC1 domain-containing protein [Pseudomonadota bacterium]